MSEGTPKKSQRADVIVPLGIIGIVLMMVLPLPPQLLDLLLAFSIAVNCRRPVFIIIKDEKDTFSRT